MLSSNELSIIQNLISDESLTFEELISKFTSFYDSSKYFIISMTLEILIIDHQLTLFQEITAFYILYYLSKEKKGYSNFSSLVNNILNETKEKVIKIILTNFLNNNLNDLHIKIVDYIKKIAENKIIYNIDNEINNLKIERNTQENKNFSFINPLIYEKQHHDNRDINKKNLKEHISDKINFKYTEPNYMSFYPILSNNIIFHNELKWILPGLKHNFIWENNCFDKIRYLINQILDNGAITTDEKNYVISSIKKKPNIINNINLTPKRMMELIEKDESLSFELLLIVCKTSLNDYLIPFLTYIPTENSIKVLSKIILNISVPKSFINNYIKNLINYYSKEPNTNEKIKRAKFIAYFINKLYENNVLTKEDEIPNEINYLFEIDNEEINKMKKYIIESRNKH